MKKLQINRFGSFQILSLLFLPITLSYLFYKIIPIQNTNPTSIVSATASVNAIIWIVIVTQIFINYPLIKKYSLKMVIQINLLFILLYVSSMKALIKALSLKGTPLPGTDIRGDLLNVVNLAKIAQNNYWSGGPNFIFSDGGYPPIWPSLIGNAARILEVHVLSLFKPAEFVLLLISPVLVLYIWRLILDTWMALIITINQTLFYNFDYKSLTLNLLIPFLIFIVVRFKDVVNNKILMYGVLIGLISLTYYGYLYWLIPFMITTTLILLLSKNSEKNLVLNTYLYLGIGIGLGPVIYFRLVESIFLYYIALLIGYLILIFMQRYRTFSRILMILVNVLLTIVLLGAFLFFRTIDTWLEGGVGKNDPTVNSIISLNGTSLVTFLLLLIGFLFVIKYRSDLSVIAVLFGVYLSSTIFMYFIASQMQVTGRVDLWPRALEVQGYALNLLFLIIFLYVIESITNNKIAIKYLNIDSHRIFYLTVFTLFLLGSFLVSSLGSAAFRSMPYHAFTGAWFAHQGCSNPHEDPMLSKVFENNADIQEFLRQNCPNVSWPAIPKTN
jgi:hypothetical protein